MYANVSAVTALSVAERALGFLYRIVLSRLIGAEGLGLYQIALSVFSTFLTIGTGGIPVTVSRMIAKSRAEKDARGESGAVTAGICLSLLLTLPFCLLFGIFGKAFGFLFSDERGLRVFQILLIGLVFSSLYAVLRGSFWGRKEFLLPSILEIAEESVMVIVGVLLLQNVENAVAGAEKAAWAAVISYLFSFSASVLCFRLKKRKLSSPKNYLKPLFNATLPITSVRACGTLINAAVAVLLPAMLIRAGASESESLQLFGVVSGMAIPLLFIPATLIGSMALVLVPELSEAFYKKNFARLQKNIERGLSFAFLIACILIPFFAVLGEDIGKIAFANELAGQIIAKSAPLLLPMSVTMISTGILNSMGFEKQSLVFYFFGAAAMLACILFLPAYCGVYAYVAGLGASYIVNAVCNFAFLQRHCPIFSKNMQATRLQSLFFLATTLFAVLLSGGFLSKLLKNIFGEILAFVCTGVCMAISTALCYAFTGILPIKDFLRQFCKKRIKNSKK